MSAFKKNRSPIGRQSWALGGWTPTSETGPAELALSALFAPGVAARAVV
jgi:hypothetical protein